MTSRDSERGEPSRQPTAPVAATSIIASRLLCLSMALASIASCSRPARPAVAPIAQPAPAPPQPRQEEPPSQTHATAAPCRSLRPAAPLNATAWTWSTRDDAIAPRAVRNTCDRLARDAQPSLRELRGVARRVEFSQFGRCFSAGRGAWILVATVSQTRASPREREARWALEFVSEDGRPFTSDAAAGDASLLLQGESSARFVGVVDIDGDGVGEAIIEQTNWDEEGSSPPRPRAYAFRDGRLSEYAPTHAMEAFSIVDADGDGHIDLLVPSEFSITTFVGMSASGESAPPRLAHGLADGTFSTADDTALRHRLAQCPRPPERIVVPSATNAARIDAGRLIDNVACARAWGATAAEVLARAEHEWLPTDDNETMRENLAEAVATEPAASLRGLCSPTAP